MYVKKRRHESIVLLLAMFIMLLVNTCWFIYGNVIYYKKRDECTDGANPAAAPELTSSMWIMIIMGYSTMLKCCCLTTVISYLVHLTRSMGLFGNRNQGIKKLLKHLKRKKIKASDLENQEAKQCSICFEDYAENETVVILPCDTRHIFHDSCISEWLKEKDTCPLCKTQITAETLKQ